MLYREIIAVCSEIHTEHIHALCGTWSNQRALQYRPDSSVCQSTLALLRMTETLLSEGTAKWTGRNTLWIWDLGYCVDLPRAKYALHM